MSAIEVNDASAEKQLLNSVSSKKLRGFKIVLVPADDQIRGKVLVKGVRPTPSVLGCEKKDCE